MVTARFDQHRPGQDRSFVLEGMDREVVATGLDEVIPAIEEAAAAARAGAWCAGFVGYEAAPAFDAALHVLPPRPESPPLAWFGVFADKCEVEPFPPRGRHPAPYTVSGWLASVDAPVYNKAIDEIHALIEAGETYQVNYSLRLQAAFSGEPLEFYRDLVLSQRGAYGAYLEVENHAILSASPERFFAIEGNAITTRPMKGTIRRGLWTAEDREMAAALHASAKDRAENLMIVDLIRSDLGRVAEFGSVSVDELFTLERYETVWQLTSEVSAELRAGTSVADVFSAMFPCGSVTGAPKPRSMGIIADLEDSPRGVYCGAVGFLAPAGEETTAASFNVAIRTVTIDRDEGIAEYGVGGAVTWDSSSEGEYEEARAKAQLLVQRRPEFDLVETMRWDGDWWWLDRHLQRMADSAEYFGYVFDRDAALARCRAAVAGEFGPRRVRLVLARTGSLSASVDDSAPDEVPLGPGGSGDPLRLAIDPEPVLSTDTFLYHKTTLRRPYEGRLSRYERADDVLLVNERGEVTESTVCNLAAFIDGRWVTPPLTSGCLPGIARSVLLDRGLVTESILTVDDVVNAESLGLVNSVRGWRGAELLPQVAD